MLNLIFVLLASQAQASSIDFQAIQSPSLKVLPALDHLPDDGRPKIVKMFSHAPSGAPARANQEACSAFHFEDLVLKIKSGEIPRSELPTEFSACEKHLTRFASSATLSEFKLAAVTYKFNEHRGIRELQLQLPGGTRRALLGLKPGRRPLVIVQCGLLCDIYDLQAKILLMDAYDFTPFHVLVLGSLSSPTETAQAQNLALGGFTEATQLMQVVHLLRDPREPISKIVSSVHMIGVSLGGQAAFYSALYASAESNPELQSVVAVCPVVNYQASAQNLVDGGQRARTLGQGSWNVIHQYLVKSTNPAARALTSWGPEKLVSLVEEIGFAEYAGLKNWLPAPLNNYEIQTREDFWRLGDFSAQAGKLTVPTFVWAAQDDDVVLTKTNTALLQNDPQVRTLISQKGLHCMEAAYYGLDVTSSILRGQLLAESGHFFTDRRDKLVPLGDIPELYDGERYFSYEWKAHEKNLELIFKIWSLDTLVGSSRCGTWDPYYAFEGCFRRASVTLSYDNFAGSELFVPRTDAEKDSLTRWANGNVRVLTKDGENLHNTLKAPTFAKWELYNTN